MDQKMKFIQEMQEKEMPFKHLCQKYGISEKTGYKWKNRFNEKGKLGLLDESRKPHSSPNSLREDEIARIVGIRVNHPYWGAKKIKAVYENTFSKDAPSISSINRILSKCDLVKKTRKRTVKIKEDPFHLLLKSEAPNDVWCVDFKGWWKSSNEICEPFTCMDLYSRKILTVYLVEDRSIVTVKAIMTELFKKYGLPKAIRSDNGSPFAVNSTPLKLTQLSAWWMVLGIIPDRTKPGHPGQNGTLERMHADIAREVENQVPGGRAANQKVLNQWVQEYNSIRPNEAIQMKRPDDVYQTSNREYVGDPDEIVYPMGFIARKVNKNGEIKLKNVLIPITTALRGHYVGLLEEGDGIYQVYLGEFHIGTINRKIACFIPLKKL